MGRFLWLNIGAIDFKEDEEFFDEDEAASEFESGTRP